MGCIGWVAATKLPTIAAMMTRMNNHRHEITGKVHPDIELAYNAMVARGNNLTFLYKAIKRWVETKDPEKLVEVAQLLDVMAVYFSVRGKHLAPDLEITRTHGIFMYAVKNGINLHEVLDRVSISALENMTEELENGKALPVYTPSTTVKEEVKEEVGADDMEVEEEDPDAEEADPTSGASRRAIAVRQTRKRVTCDAVLSQELSMNLSIKQQLGTMVLNALGVQLSHMRGLYEKGDLLKDFMEDLRALQAVWKEKVRALSCDSSFESVLESAILVLACSNMSEPKRPVPSQVRLARASLLDMAKTKLPESCFAKKFIMQENSKPFWDASLAYAQAGLHDEAATKSVRSVVERFEREMDNAFNGIEDYINGDVATNRQQLTMESFTTDTQGIGPTCAATLVCVQRWTEATLEEECPELVGLCSNIGLLAAIGITVMVKTSLEEFLSVTSGPSSSLGHVAASVDGGDAGLHSVSLSEGAEAENAGTATTASEQVAPQFQPGASAAVEIQPYSGIEQAISAYEALNLITGSIITGAKNLIDKAAERLGAEKASESFEEVSTFFKALEAANVNNIAFVADTIKYGKACEHLQQYPSPETLSANACAEDTVQQETAYIIALRDFATVQDKFKACWPPAVNTSFSIIDQNYGADITQCIHDHWETTGENLYEAHITSGMVEWATAIKNEGIDVKLVSKEVVATIPWPELLEQIIENPKPEMLVGCAFFERPPPGKQFEIDTKEFGHWRKAESLRQFSNTLRLDAISWKDNGESQGARKSGPAQPVLHCCDLVCTVRDLCLASATLRDVILPYVDNDKQVEKELLLNYVTPLVKFVLVTSGKLEGLLASALTRHIEQSDARFMMHASMETLRIWQTLTASLGERFMNFVISSFNIFLAEEIKATKCALPTPSVCFDGDKVFQEAMAKEELGGTLANSIAAHNQLHAMIVQVAQASNTLGLTPPLETNAKTKKVIAQAQAALREAKDCAVSPKAWRSLRRGTQRMVWIKPNSFIRISLRSTSTLRRASGNRSSKLRITPFHQAVMELRRLFEKTRLFRMELPRAQVLRNRRSVNVLFRRPGLRPSPAKARPASSRRALTRFLSRKDRRSGI